jgi:hypothetical protein
MEINFSARVRGFPAGFRLSQWEENAMLAYLTNRLYDPRPALETPATRCLICRDEVTMIEAEKAAAICQCSRRRIYRWIEDGDLHFTELASGEVLVCGRSLSKKMDELDSSTTRLTTV